MKKLIVNKVLCKKCNDIIESKHTHDLMHCQCGMIAIDGGTEYQKYLWGMNATEEISEADEYIDFSYTIFEEENKTVSD